MKKVLSVVLCIIMLLSSVSICFADEKVYYVDIDLRNESPFGPFHGWGTSICWWGHHLGENLNDEQLDMVAEALYDKENGLGLNIARYNIGGGDDPTHNHQRKDDGRDMPGLTTAPNEWKLENDLGQIKALKATIKYGADIVEAFSNSPPYYMTKSGCSSGNEDAGKNNLKEDQYDEFAEYLAEAVLRISKEYGIEFDTLEPFNESDTNYWGKDGWQEGCHFDVEDHSKLIVLVREALNKRGLTSVGVSASDETNVWRTGENIKNVYTKEAIAALSQVNTHSYSVGDYNHTKNAVLEAGKPLYMSEVDGDATLGGRAAGNMAPAHWFAQKLTDDIKGLEPNGWVMWQATAMSYPGEAKDTGYWNICSFDKEKNVLNKFKKYYAYMQYTKFIRPGDTLVKMDEGNIVAAVNKENGKIVYVINNVDSRDKQYAFNVGNLGTTIESAECYVTDKTRNCEKVSGDNYTDYYTANIPAYSVYTVVLNTKPFMDKNAKITEKNNTVTAFVGEELVFTAIDADDKETVAAVSFDEAGTYNYAMELGDATVTYPVNVVDIGSKVRIIGSGSERALKVFKNDVVISDRTSFASQIWTMEKHGDYFAFRNEKTGKYLSTENFLTTSDKLTDKELWVLEKDKGLYRIINKANEESIDVYNHATENGAQVGVYGGYYGTPNQLFYFENAECLADNDTEYMHEDIVLSGVPFGTNPWDGDKNVTYDKAWDGDIETFFHSDRDADRTGYTGIDLGEGHLPFNKIVLNSRPGFEYRGYGATISGSNEKDGDYELIYTFKLEDFTRREEATILLDEMVNYRYIKYETPLGGYCNIGEISLRYDARQSDMMIIAWYDGDNLVRTDVVKNDEESLAKINWDEYDAYRLYNITKESVIDSISFHKKVLTE